MCYEIFTVLSKHSFKKNIMILMEEKEEVKTHKLRGTG